jgi:hypothetical protein
VYLPPTPPAPLSSFVIPVTPFKYLMISPPTPAPAQPITFPDFYAFAPAPQPNASLANVPSDVWGTVLFYMDGRVREVQTNGNS